MNFLRKTYNIFLVSCLSLSFLTVAWGCKDDLIFDSQDYADLGRKIDAKVSINLGADGPVVSTRAFTHFGDRSGYDVKVDNYWVGLFDTKTGELIGSDYNEKYRKESDGNRYTLRNDDRNNPLVIKDIDISYYEYNPEAYIIGVINYNNVLGRNVGDSETRRLIDVLNEVKDLKDMAKVSVDIASAETTNNDKAGGNVSTENGVSYGDVPVMMGFYSTDNLREHVTLSSDGKVSSDKVKVRFATNDAHSIEMPEGSVKLQRLMADVNIVVTDGYNVSGSGNVVVKPVPGGDGFDISDFPPFLGGEQESFEILDLSYKVVNNPTEVFLSEHPTDKSGAKRTSKDEYLAATANSADFLDKGYVNTPNNYTSYGNDYDGFIKAPSTWVPTDESEQSYRKIYNIHYQHYENKHYGTTDDYSYGSPHALREAKWNNHDVMEDAANDMGYTPEGYEEPVFKSLCASEDNKWNNNASYIVLKATVKGINNLESNSSYNSFEEGKEAYTGTVYFTIHEGYTVPYMSSNPPEIRDFETVRNTSYYYSVLIRGLNQLYFNVYASSFGDVPDYENYHDDGIQGSMVSDLYKVVSSEGQMADFMLPQMTAKEKLDNLNMALGIPTLSTDNNEVSYTIYPSPNSVNQTPNVMEPIMEFPIIPEVDVTRCNRVPLSQLPEKYKNCLTFYPLIEDSSNSGVYTIDENNKMTLQEYLSANDNGMIAIKVEKYNELEGDEKDYIKARFFMFYVMGKDLVDSHGCRIDNPQQILIQRPDDDRYVMDYFAPAKLQHIEYSSSNSYKNFNVYSVNQGLTDTDYIRWWVNESSDPQYLPLSYTIKIDGSEYMTINQSDFEKYRHYSSEYPFYPKSAQYFYEVPLTEIDNASTGDYDLTIEANVNSDKVKRVPPIENTLRVVGNPYWRFDDDYFPLLGNSYNGVYSYAGMTATGAPIYNSGYAELDGGSIDSGSLRFTISKHGKFKVTAQNLNGSSDASSNRQRHIKLVARGKGGSSISEPVVYNNGMQTVYVDTRDIIGNFANGPTDVALVSDYRLQVYEIEFIEDNDPRGSVFAEKIEYSNKYKGYNDYPYEGADYDGGYIHNPDFNDPEYYHYVVPGFETKFAFIVSNGDAPQYQVEIYDPDNHNEPLFTQTFDAEECHTFQKYVSYLKTYEDYYVVGLYVPSENSLTAGKSYDVAVRPTGDPSKFKPGNPYFLTTGRGDPIIKVIETEDPQWWNPDNYSYADPFYASRWNSMYAFHTDKSKEQWEYQGLVLHGGTTFTVSTDNINFQGTGYPANGNNSSTGRYLSFKTDRKGKISITGQQGGTSVDRKFHLYKVVNGNPQKIDEKTYTSKQSQDFETGEVNGLTEFIICPEQGIYLYGISFESE